MSKIPIGFIQAIGILATVRPDVVVSYGGYLSFPVALAAKLLSIPLVVHEQTTAWGIANKLTKRWARFTAVSWPNLAGPEAELIGNPLRQEVLSIVRSENNARPVLYITGGHQGSRAIDKALLPILQSLVTRFEVYHQTQSRPGINSRYYHYSNWFSTLQHASILTKANLVVSRAGANSVSELAYLGIPAVLIPLPHSGFAEQSKNAVQLESTGLARIIEQKDLTSSSLLNQINIQMKRTKLDLIQAGKLSKKLVLPDAGSKLAKIILSIGREHG